MKPFTKADTSNVNKNISYQLDKLEKTLNKGIFQLKLKWASVIVNVAGQKTFPNHADACAAGMF